MARTTPRTPQDLLAERRATVRELRSERDPVARATLTAQIAVLDAAIDRREVA